MTATSYSTHTQSRMHNYYRVLFIERAPMTALLQHMHRVDSLHVQPSRVVQVQLLIGTRPPPLHFDLTSGVQAE